MKTKVFSKELINTSPYGFRDCTSFTNEEKSQIHFIDFSFIPHNSFSLLDPLFFNLLLFCVCIASNESKSFLVECETT